MYATPEHPTTDQLSKLIQGTLSVRNNDMFTVHLGDCEACREVLQSLATGEIPVEALVGELNELSKTDQSALWNAIEKVTGEVHAVSKSSNATDTPMSSQSPVSTDFGRAGSVSSVSDWIDLGFLEPSNDTAYIGKLQHFLVSRVIGRGGMGLVLEAFDTQLHRSVAIKVLNPQYQTDEIARQRFCREGRAVAAISHEHVASIFQVAQLNNSEVVFLVMQLVDGDTLENRLRSGGPLPTCESVRLAIQIAAGLSATHKQELVHRDIKPANILIENASGRVKLTDFGLAIALDDVKLTKTGVITGTPLYMSPEQTLGKPADERSDLFSFGAVMYEMASGIPPFQSQSTLGVMQRIRDEAPVPPNIVNASVPQPMSELIMSLLEKKSERRPRSAVDVVNALVAIATDHCLISPLQLPAMDTNGAEKAALSSNRNQNRLTTLAWLIACLATATAIASLVLWPRKDLGDSFPSVTLPGNSGTVWSVDFSKGGSKVAAAIEDGSVRIWNIDNQELEKNFYAHRGIVWKVEYHSSKPLFLTSGDDASIKLWNADTYELIREWKADNAVRSVTFSPTNNQIAAGDRVGNLLVFDFNTGELIAHKVVPGSILGVDYSADGKLIASVGSEKVVRIFDSNTLEERQSLNGHDGAIYNVAFAPCGHLLASVGWDKNVRIWNTETGAEVMNLEGSEGDVWGVSFCGDGDHIITGEQMGAARVWDMRTRKPIATLRGHTSAVHNVSLDPNSPRIATSSRDGTIRIWDMSDCEE